MSPTLPRLARTSARSFRTRVWDYLFGNTVPACLRTSLGFEPLEAREVPATVAVTLFGTGVGVNGTPLADDATDPHYELVSNGGTSLMPGPVRALSADGFPIGPWVGNGTDSRWIVPAATDGDGNAAAGSFDYRTTFDLTGIDPSTVTIEGKWAADDAATIYLNGVNTGITTASPAYGSLADFSLATGFRPGVNTLDFVVSNSGGPTGLQVQGISGFGRQTPQVAASGLAFSTGVSSAGVPLSDTSPPAVTGLPSTGAGLSDGATDGNFTLSNAPAGYGGATKVLSADGNFPFPYWTGAAEAGGSAWLVPAAADDRGNAPAGDYWFSTTVNVTDPANLVLSGKWAADDHAAIFVNGVATGVTIGAPAYGALVPFRLAGSYFTAGANTVEFRVTNGGSSANPTGLRVSWDVQSPTIDSHWTVVEAPDPSLVGPTKVLAGGAYPFPRWVADDENSRWIAPLNAAADASAAPGTYKYQTTIDLTGYDPATAVLSGRWSADNEGVNVYLNGVPLNLSVGGPDPGSGVEAYHGYADLYIANGVGGAAFQAGLNTLTFEVRNDQLGSGNNAENPVGLRVDDLQLSLSPVLEPGTIQGSVWTDLDNDGGKGIGEAGQAGINVGLFDSVGNHVVATTTDQDGSYLFSGVTPGIYAVQVMPVDGHTFSGGGSVFEGLVTVSSGETVNLNIPLYGPSVSVFASGSPKEDGSATGTFTFVRSGDTSLDLLVNYEISGTATPGSDYGTLTGQVTIPAGHSSADVVASALDDEVADPDESIVVKVQDGSGYIAGGYAEAYLAITDSATGIIRGRVWADGDGDGIRSDDEGGAGGVTVALLQGGTVVTDTVTDSAGYYQFSGLIPHSDYRLSYASPDWATTLTAPDQGPDDARDSDVDPATGLTNPIAVAAGQATASVDAGFLILANQNQQPSIAAKLFTYKEYRELLDNAANKAALYADFKSEFNLDLTDPDVQKIWDTQQLVAYTYASVAKVDGAQQDVVRGSFMSNVKFSVTNFNTLTAQQKANNYLVQTVKSSENNFDANGKLIGRETTYLVEAFNSTNGLMDTVDTHSRTRMLTGHTLDAKAVKTVWVSTFTIGYGTYDGKTLADRKPDGSLYSADKTWDATKLSYAVQPITYTITFTVNADKTWSLEYTGAIKASWSSPKPKK